MASETFAQLSPAATLTGAEIVPIMQGGVTLRTTAGAIGSANQIGANLTYSQLTVAYTAANVTGYPEAITTDCGLVSWNGTTWVQAEQFVLAQGGVPLILPPSGSVGNNGALSLGSALYTTYASCYMFFGASTLYTSPVGNYAGLYYVQMSSTTTGTVFANLYEFGNPQIPASPTAISATGPGAYTQITGQAIILASGNVPGNVMGPNGEVEFDYVWTSNNSADNKRMNATLGGQVVSSTDVETTAQFRAATHYVRNRGTSGSQISFNSTSGDSGTGTGMVYNAIPTNSSQPMNIQAQLDTAATSWVVLESFSMKCSPASALDNQPSTLFVVPSGTSIVPPGAAALGYTVNKIFINPTLASVDFTNNSALGPLYPGAQSQSSGLTGNSPKGYLALNYSSSLQQGSAAATKLYNQYTAGPLGVITAANGFYVEAAIQLTDNNTDHWPAFYLNPFEHSNGNLSYVEHDVDEGGYVFNAWNPFWGMKSTIIDWTATGGNTWSGTQYSNLSNLASIYSGPNIDRTKEHIFGHSYDPIGQVCAFWLDGVKQAWTQSVAAFNSLIINNHYYLVLDADSHGQHLSYSMYIRYIAAWSSQ